MRKLTTNERIRLYTILIPKIEQNGYKNFNLEYERAASLIAREITNGYTKNQ